MNRTLLITAAAIAVAFAQPVYARDGGGGGGGHFGGGGGHFGGGAHFGGGRSFGGGSSFTASRGFSPSFSPSRVTTSARSFRQSPTFAFGGSRTFDRNVGSARNFSRSDFRGRPPQDISRNWDRGHMHNWNHHRFRFFNNDWVLFDNGFDGWGYADPYYDSTPYYGDTDSYDDSTSAPAQWSVADTGSLPAAVQEELARRGYNPGPVDGVLGPQTRNAIAKFQNDQRLPATGRIDRSVLNALNL